MGGADGAAWETLDRIREITDVPLLALAEGAPELERARALRAGADDVMCHPIGAVELAARIEALMRRARKDYADAYVDSLVSVDYERSANGKVFLAFGRATLPEPPLPRLTPKTITDPAQLESELETVRRQGFATTVDELETGLAAVAAPVRGAGGDVVAALSISGPTLRMTPRRLRELEPVLIEEARSLERRLGHIHEGEHAA